MATLTIRNLPDDITAQLKRLAEEHQCSMEQEVRNILQEKVASRSELLDRLASRAKRLPAPKATEVADWIAAGRSRNRT